MKQESFIYWLQGMLEGNPENKKGLSAEQVKIIEDHLKLVLTKVTPEYIPGLTSPWHPITGDQIAVPYNPDITYTPVPQNPFGPGTIICSTGTPGAAGTAITSGGIGSISGMGSLSQGMGQLSNDAKVARNQQEPECAVVNDWQKRQAQPGNMCSTTESENEFKKRISTLSQKPGTFC